MPTPTQRTLKYYRDKGYTAAITEKWNAWAGIRQDLFGFIDIVVLAGDEGIFGVQASSGDHHAHRRTKILESPEAIRWLQAGARIFVITWKKVSARKFTIREEEILLDDFIARKVSSSS